MTSLIFFLLLALPQFSEEVDVHLATIDVVVTDSAGHQILNLTPEDFTLLEEGKPVEINSLEYYSTRHPVKRDAELRPVPIPGRRFVIVIQRRLDLSDFAILKDMQRDLSRFIRNDLKSGDEIAIFTFRSRLTCLVDFTRERDTLLTVIQDRLLMDKGSELPSWFQKREKMDRSIFIDAMETLTENLRYLDGRKDMILFSYGFGKITYGSMASPVGDYSTSRQFQDLLQSLNDSNITTHVIDLHRGTTSSMEGMLSTVADRTGGHYYGIMERYAAVLKKIEQVSSGYYLITYYPSKKSDGENYRKVEVEVKNPEFRVRAREGFYY